MATGEIQPRLSINLNNEAAEFIDEVMQEESISVTEVVRRALGVYKEVRAAIKAQSEASLEEGVADPYLTGELNLPTWRRDEKPE